MVFAVRLIFDFDLFRIYFGLTLNLILPPNMLFSVARSLRALPIHRSPQIPVRQIFRNYSYNVDRSLDGLTEEQEELRAVVEKFAQTEIAPLAEKLDKDNELFVIHHLLC